MLFSYAQDFEISVSNSYLAVDVHIDNSSPFSSQNESDRFFMLNC